MIACLHPPNCPTACPDAVQLHAVRRRPAGRGTATARPVPHAPQRRQRAIPGEATQFWFARAVQAGRSRSARNGLAFMAAAAAQFLSSVHLHVPLVVGLELAEKVLPDHALLLGHALQHLLDACAPPHRKRAQGVRWGGRQRPHGGSSAACTTTPRHAAPRTPGPTEGTGAPARQGARLHSGKAERLRRGKAGSASPLRRRC